MVKFIKLLFISFFSISIAYGISDKEYDYKLSLLMKINKLNTKLDNKEISKKEYNKEVTSLIREFDKPTK